MRDNINFYSQFKSWYDKIIETFNFNPDMDREARDYLSQILVEKDPNWNVDEILVLFKESIEEKKNIFIFGCGPTLEISIQELIKEFGVKFFNNTINLVADGASVLLKEVEIPIDGLFTDLDGISQKEFNYANFIIIHAHGDNIRRIKFFKNAIINFRNLICTTQVKPCDNIINPGGFTDGDRILYFLKNLILPTQRIFLFGMDFGNIVGRYSKPTLNKKIEITPIKLKKLQFAVKLIESLLVNIRNKVYFVNSNKISKKFSYLSISDFKKMIKF
ncbi:MAG: DUF115 domain-containing protein [Candidatus Lokiarchaeota archaeon]|nr:DUF115 domain-containing protein [Candidatus Lokiarchaeota archaeon]